jgi:DNA-binding response OmpR family regulator
MKVLVVDDDLALADVVSFIMQRAGFEVILAHNGVSALQRWETETPDLIILDLNLPKLDGLSVCRRIRADDDTPIIILSVRGEEDDVVEGLRSGADDYIVKPFSPRQMVARAEAVLRRAGTPPLSGNLLKAGELTLDLNRNEVQVGKREPAQLTRLESRLLDILLRNSGQVVPTDMLIDHVWGPSGGDRIMLKQLIYRLRRKIEPDPSNPIFLETRSNIGYTLVI